MWGTILTLIGSSVIISTIYLTTTKQQKKAFRNKKHKDNFFIAGLIIGSCILLLGLLISYYPDWLSEMVDNLQQFFFGPTAEQNLENIDLDRPTLV